MLSRLSIENFALIDKLDIEFGDGLNVLTGSTGAGKSIIIGALDLVLGGRGSEEIIRTGARNAAVEAEFLVNPEELKKRDKDLSGYLSDSDRIVIRREYRKGGGGKAYIAGSQVNLAVIKSVAPGLASILGQHSHQTLLDSSTHLSYLDLFAGHEQRLAELKDLFKRTADLKDKLSYSRRYAREIAEKIELLNFQISEIEKAHLEEGEEEKLKEEKKLHENSLRIREAGDMAAGAFTESDDSVSERIGEVVKALGQLKGIVPEIEDILGLVNSASDSINESVIRINSMIEKIDDDPQRLDEINERLQEIFRLRKKYGGDITFINNYRRESCEELERIKSNTGSAEDLEREFKASRHRLNNLAAEISEARKQARSGLEKSIADNLAVMGMPKARFATVINNTDDRDGLYSLDDRNLAGDSTGFDVVEFQFCANPGEGLKPLARIASGGEISRVMLALKNAFLRGSSNGCEVFDEIDVGISGDVAAMVARQLKKLSRIRQVICITHLHQIASSADNHYRVFKDKAKGRSVTRIVKLDTEERIREIAVLLSGEIVSQAALKGARELLEDAADE